MNKKKSLLSLVMTVVILTLTGHTLQAQSKSDKKTAGYSDHNYEVECLGTGTDGTQIMKVWGYGKKPEEAIIEAKRNAVHAVMFKGVATGKPGCGQRPLISNPDIQIERQEYFDTFFEDGGHYLHFVSLTGEEIQDRVKIKKMYKVGIKVVVNKDQLRRELEREGIIKGLGSGF